MLSYSVGLPCCHQRLERNCLGSRTQGTCNLISLHGAVQEEQQTGDRKAGILALAQLLLRTHCVSEQVDKHRNTWAVEEKLRNLLKMSFTTSQRYLFENYQ